MKYVSCPECGARLIEGEEGSKVQIKCRKCGKLVKASISSDGVHVSAVKPPPEHTK